MWDVYTNNRRIRLPRFWQEAFEAAYEDLTSDVPVVANAAISEIAKMSLRTIDLEPPPLRSSVGIPCYYSALFSTRFTLQILDFVTLRRFPFGYILIYTWA